MSGEGPADYSINMPGLHRSQAIHLQKAGLDVSPCVKATELCYTNLAVLI